ncbi:GOLPH3/VPS74 family protein [Actinoplanes sp. RD1]|uniref:GOLPH3/VPS74 family protein n=1 Tax=Actinoplanes sp. RD1 TaxID=3064538 RepID=UPI0027427D51|nr:GPP34 family phosphoprotein [Actinoplanes sp. RD1]
MPPIPAPLADDLFLAAHDSVHGRCLLSPAILGLGLGGAVLAELVLGQRLDVRGDHLALLDDRPTGDVASAAVLGHIIRDADRGVRDWIAYLGGGIAPDLVGRRLARTGQVRRLARRSFFGTKLITEPVDSVASGRPGTRVRVAAERREPLPRTDLTLAGLIFATGLDQYALATVGTAGRKHLLDLLRRRLPEPLQRLLGHAEAAVGEAVLARRA